MSDEREVGRSRALVEVGQYAQAADRLGRHLAGSPEDAYALAVLGQALLGTGDWAGSAAAAGRSAALEPDWEWPHRIAGIALQRLGRRREAVRSVREAVRLAPDTWRGHAQLARVLLAPPSLLDRLRAGRPAVDRMVEAQQEAERAVELAPEEPETHAALGEVSLARGRRQDAAEAYERVLALSPQDPEGLHGLAMTRAKQGRLTSAIGGFAAAAAVDPHDASAAHNVLLMAWRLHCRLLVMLVGVVFVVANLIGSPGQGDDSAPRVIAVPVTIMLLAGVVVFSLRTVRGFPLGVRQVVRRAAVRGYGLVASSFAALAGLLLLAAPWPSGQTLRFGFVIGAVLCLQVAWVAGSVWVSRQRAAYERGTRVPRAPWWRYQR